MSEVLWLFALQGLLGAFDTLYYHEWRARLVAHLPDTRPELLLHAGRSLIYGVLFGTLPWLAWQGAWALLLLVLIVAEIGVTLCDFVVEDRTRRALGGVYPGERVSHALMGIIYGAMLANFHPVYAHWLHSATALTPSTEPIPIALRWVLTAMAVGVTVSGLRDLYAGLGLPHGAWPWARRQNAIA